MALVIWQTAKFLAAFALVIFLAAAGSRLLAVRAQAPVRGALRVLGAVGLGAGRSVAAVQVGRRVLVLGLAEKTIALLCTLEDAAELGGPPEPAESVPPAFSRYLGAALERLKHRA